MKNDRKCRAEKDSKTKRVSFSESPRSEKSVEKLLQEAESLHKILQKTSNESCFEIGQRLIEAKNQVRERKVNWQKWLQSKQEEGLITFSIRTAQMYMQVARNKDRFSEEASFRRMVAASQTQRKSEVVRKKAERIAFEIVADLLDGWTNEEKAWLSGKYENSSLNTEAEYLCILKPGFEDLRNKIKAELKGGRK